MQEVFQDSIATPMLSNVQYPHMPPALFWYARQRSLTFLTDRYRAQPGTFITVVGLSESRASVYALSYRRARKGVLCLDVLCMVESLQGRVLMQCPATNSVMTPAYAQIDTLFPRI